MKSRLRVLLATRAVESPPREGGYVMLMDIAQRLIKDTKLFPAVFSSSIKPISGIKTEKIFSKPGWDTITRQQYMIGLLRKAHKYDVVHTAHIPTNKNVRLIKSAIRYAKHKNTFFVQTITGLPRVNISNKELGKLLWGDHIVCQSVDAYKQVKKIRNSVSLISPWAPSGRISFNSDRRSTTRQKFLSNQSEKIILFPGEFERLGVDISFGDCLEELFNLSGNCKVFLACRFDKEKIGETISNRFPGKVISIGETKDIIELIEAADLTIYPVKKMDSKFQPPLVLAESLQLGTPILVSHLIDIDYPDSRILSRHDISKSWSGFAKKMAELVNEKGVSRPIKSQDQLFEGMFKSYRDIYLSAKQLLN